MTLLECNFNDYSNWPENFARFLGTGLGQTLSEVRLSGHDVNKEDETAMVAQMMNMPNLTALSVRYHRTTSISHFAPLLSKPGFKRMHIKNRSVVQSGSE